jgi:hypothetical protein
MVQDTVKLLIVAPDVYETSATEEALLVKFRDICIV